MSAPLSSDSAISPVRTSWRPEIQALRAVAVLLVVLYHLWPTRVTGGFVGVDAFFVISGFLISAHLLREVSSTGRIRLGAFWARRIRRLLPAAMLVIVFSGLMTLLIAPRSLVGQFFSEIAASAGYFVNWLLANNAVDYFSEENAASPVQHYWSLSVEEQFYLVWPVLLAVVALIARRSAKVRGRAILAVIVVVAAVSLALSIVGSVTAPEYSYFSSPVHAWEFAGGAGLAWFEAWRSGRGAKRVSDAVRIPAAWAGYALLISSGLVLTGAAAFPGWIAIWPVAGVLLVIWAGTSTHRLSSSHLAGWRPVTFVGDISYSLYLWHWPLIVFAGYAFPTLLTGRVHFAVLAVSVVAAYLTTRFVENPIRFAKPLVRHNWLTYTLAAVATFAVIAASLQGIGYQETLRTTSVAESRALAQESIDGELSCFGAGAVESDGSICSNPELGVDLFPMSAVASEDRGGIPENCLVAESAKVKKCELSGGDAPVLTVALVGDSHAAQYAPALVELAKANGWQLTTYTRGSCAWRTPPKKQTDDLINQTESCADWNRGVQKALLADEPDVIITSAYSRDFYWTVADPEPTFSKRLREEAAAGIASAWKVQEKNGSIVIPIADGPRWSESAVDCLSAIDDERADECVLPADVAYPFRDPQWSAARTLNGIELLDLGNYFCTADKCPATIGNVIVYRDLHHITATYALTLSPMIGDAIDDAVARAK